MGPGGEDGGGPAAQEVALADGRRMVLRPSTASDVEGLAALYDALPDVDLYHRFFSVFHPDRRFVERWATLGRRGGCGLVVELDDGGGPGGGPSLVAEAGYVPLPDGDADMAICVRPDWRGWVGSFLLDALLRVAGARGITHLQADVLWENRAMVALAHSCGGTRLEQPDPAEVRLRIPTRPVDPDLGTFGPAP